MNQQETNVKNKIKCKCLRNLGSLQVMEASYRKQNFSRHTHDCYAFGFITAGRLDFSYQHKDWQANQGDINLVVPGEVHDGHGADNFGWSYKMLYLPIEIVHEANFNLTGTDTLPYFLPGVISDKIFAKGLQDLHEILTEEGAPVLQQESMLWHWLGAFISVYAGEMKKSLHFGKEDVAVQIIKEYLQQHYANSVSLKDLAEVTKLNPYYLLHVFKNAVGIPPHLFQQQLRVQKAKTLLAAGAALTAVAYETGFADQSHFSRQFKKITGLTPAGYQKMF